MFIIIGGVLFIGGAALVWNYFNQKKRMEAISGVETSTTASLQERCQGVASEMEKGFFEEIAEVEEQHEKRYRKLLKNVKNGAVFKRDKEVQWKCRNCGYVHSGKEAPITCPACMHSQKYYELLCENY